LDFAPTALPHKQAVTNDGSVIFDVWSLDGKFLLNRRNTEPRGSSLWMASAKGDNRRLIVRRPVADAMFTRDGRHILYLPTFQCCSPPIMRVDLNAGERRVYSLHAHIRSKPWWRGASGN